MGEPITTGLAIAQAGVAIVGAFSQAANAKKQEKDAKKAAAEQTAETYVEIARQQGEVNRIAGEQVSDRIRAANAELGAARVAAGERGVSGTTMSAIVRNIGYLEGADLARIEKNREANIEAGESQKRSAKRGFFESVTIARNQAAAANTSAFLGAAGSGLQIAGNYFNQSAQLAAMQNRRM